MALGPVELFVITVIAVAAVVSAIAVVVDVNKYPASAFEAIGASKKLWIVLPIVGVFFCAFVAIIAAIIWFTKMKDNIAAAAAAG